MREIINITKSFGCKPVLFFRYIRLQGICAHRNIGQIKYVEGFCEKICLSVRFTTRYTQGEVHSFVFLISRFYNVFFVYLMKLTVLLRYE